MLVEKKAIGTIGRMWGNQLSSRWVDCFIEMLQYSTEKLIKDPTTEYIHYVHADVSWHEQGRNQMVMEAKGDWLFQMDTDHCFSPDTLIRLLYLMDKYKVDVISGIYQYKVPPHGPVAGILVPDPENESMEKLEPLVDWEENKEIVPVTFVGGGCLLVKNSVYRRINEELKEGPFNIIPGLSEDYSFCARCKKLGIPVNLAVNVECHHEITSLLYVGDYLREKRAQRI